MKSKIRTDNGGYYDGPGRCAADTFCRRDGIIALPYRQQASAAKPEYDALDNAFLNVGEFATDCCICCQKDPYVDAEQHDATTMCAPSRPTMLNTAASSGIE